jgi:hypothetical protein
VEDLRFVDLLITRGQEAYGRIVADDLLRFGFQLYKNSEGDRIIVGSDGVVYTAMYRVFVWEASSRRRLVWFVLESQLPHMSSLVACIGFPRRGSSMPVFVMNLNLKRKLGTYSTVIGFRGCTFGLQSVLHFVPLVKPGLPKPLFVKELPDGFRGIRLIFPLAEAAPVIDWSLSVAERTLGRWLAATDRAANFDSHYAEAEEDMRLYAQEMKELHGIDGRVFDAVFGEGWVSRVFNDSVFGRQD